MTLVIYIQVKAETIILRGDPREMICQAAEQVHVDLLVLGNRGLGTISRYYFYPPKFQSLIILCPKKKEREGGFQMGIHR